MAKQLLGALLTLTAQGAATLTTPDQTSNNHVGLKIPVNISAVSGTPTLTVTIQGKDEVSGTYYTVLQSAALSATGFTMLTVYPGAIASANTIANDILPRVWRVQAVVAGGTPSVTATIGATLTGNAV